MANWIITDSVNLRHPMVNTQGTAAEVLMLPLDNKAHTWQVVVRDGYTDADLTGKSCYAYFARNDNAKVLVNGTITGNVCSVTLDSTCYAIPGFLRAVMIMSDTDQTVAICEKTFRVNPALPGQTVDPGETIPSYDDLLAEIGAMRLATSEAIAATNAARTATTAANTATQNANTKAEAAQTAANNANQATTAANQATANANTAAQNANAKADQAQTAANNADQATTAATAATAAAQTATTDANNAAQNANTAASTITNQIDRLDAMDRNQNARLSNLEAASEGYLYNVVEDSETAFSKTVPDKTLPYANLDMVGGKTLVWNQYADMTRCLGNIPDGREYTVGAYAGQYFSFAFSNVREFTPVIGDRYYVSFFTKSTKTYDFGIGIGSYVGMGSANNAPNEWTRVTRIVTVTGTNYGNNLYVFTNASPRVFESTDTIAVKNVVMVNLMQLFGGSYVNKLNNDQLLNEFEAMFPADYYPYSDPTLMSFSADKVVSKGRNLVDLSEFNIADNAYTHNYSIDAYQTANKLKKVLAENVGKEISYTVTTIGTQASGMARIGQFRIYADGDNILTVNPNSKFVVPDSIASATNFIVYGSIGGATVKDFQFALTDDILPYAPYRDPITTDLSALVSKYFPDGMKSAGDVHDSFEQDDAGKWWAVKRVGSTLIDGSNHFAGMANSTSYACAGAYTRLPNGYNASDNSPGYLISDKFGNDVSRGANIEGVSFQSINNTLVFFLTKEKVAKYGFDESSTPAQIGEQIKNYIADNPVTVNYKIEPIRTEVTDPVPSSISVEAGGSMTFANDKGDNYRVPLPNAETYMIKLGGEQA